MNTQKTKNLSILLFTLAFGLATGCSYTDPYAEHGMIPPKNDSAHADASAGAFEGAEGNDIEDKENDELAQFWIQFSTDDSTSMASAQLHKAGRYGGLPHEFVNYYDPPAHLFNEEAWGIEEDLNEAMRLGLKATEAETITEVYPCNEGEEQGFEVVGEQECEEEKTVVDLLFQMQADATEATERDGWNLYLCVDVSGSMAGTNMQLTKRALSKTVDHLQAGDRVTLVTFSNQANLKFENLEFSANETTIRNAFENLTADGGTNMSAGLETAYRLAQDLYDAAATNRVILFSDGAANVGDTQIQNFEALTRISGEEGIYLSGVGVGHNYDMARMDALTDAGKGAHVFLPNMDEVELIFGDYFQKMVEVAADRIAIEMLLPEGLKLEGFSGEEASLDPEQRLQNIILASGDDMTFTARFEVVDEAALTGPATLRVTYRPLSTGEEQIIEFDVDNFSDLMAEPGSLFERTQLVSDFAKYATGHQGATRSLQEVIDSVASSAEGDWGLTEIQEQLLRNQ